LQWRARQTVQTRQSASNIEREVSSMNMNRRK
jgi:hypothetical protein